MKYLILIVLFVSCREKKIDNGSVNIFGVNAKAGDSIFLIPIHDTVFFNDRNSTVYLHDTIYKIKIKYTKPDYYYIACDTLGNPNVIIWDTSKVIVDTFDYRPATLQEIFELDSNYRIQLTDTIIKNNPAKGL